MIADAKRHGAAGAEHRSLRRHGDLPWAGRASGGRRGSRGPGGACAPPEPLAFTADGFPAAIPDAPRPSPVVPVSDESRARHPWLPRRVIAGSVWLGPLRERVKVDERGVARAWRRGAPQARDGSWRELVAQVGVRR